MKAWTWFLAAALVCPAAPAIAAWGKPVDYPNAAGGTLRLPLEGEVRLTVLCFLGTECPLARLYGPRLDSLARKFASDGVRFVGVNSNRQDSLDDVQAYAREYGVAFPLLKDYDCRLADQFGVQRAPEVIVLDGLGTVHYRGRVDDQYQPGLTRRAPTREHLAMAIDELLAGKQVSVASTEPVGCLIGRNPVESVPTKLTWCRDISRVLQRNCVECHRAGDIGPFALTDYDEAVGWGEMLLEVIADGRMPPWHATGNSVPFVNQRAMPEADKAALREWVAGGMPYGAADDLPPPLPSTPEWWLGRPPDAVVSMPKPFVVPADGTVDYQYFVVDPGFKEDRWVAGAQVIPGNRVVVHHCIVFIRPPDGVHLRGVGWLTAYVPGQRILAPPPGMARKVPAGSQFVFQMHYTPNGTEQSDQTKVGMLFCEEAAVDHELFTLMAMNQDFEIPPGAADHVVSATLSDWPTQSKLLAFAPHMHVRGKACCITAETKQGERLLLDVPRYDFNWQHLYALEDAIPLDDVASLTLTAHFDNSAENPVNPNPNEYVTWGDQTWQEMAVAFFEAARPRTADETRSADRRNLAQADAHAADVERFVNDFYQQFDADRDGAIFETEVPLSVKRFGFRKLDTDDDGRLTRDEIAAHAADEFR